MSRRVPHLGLHQPVVEAVVVVVAAVRVVAVVEVAEPQVTRAVD